VTAAIEARRWAVRRCLIIAGVLALGKLAIGFFTGSLGILASAVDSTLDILLSSVNYWSLRIADRPADANHRYGHGKIESLAGLFESLVIMWCGGIIVAESWKRLWHPQPLGHVELGVATMAVSAAASYWLVRSIRRAQRQTESAILRSESVHYASDALANVGVVLTLLLVRWTGQAWWDLVISIVIAASILWSAGRLLKGVIDELMDRELPEKLQKAVADAILSFHPQIVGFHNLRTRQVGPRKFIDVHIEIRGEQSFQRAHELTESLIKSLEQRVPGADVTVHYDPEGAQ